MEHSLQVRILKELFSQIDEKRNADAGRILKNPASAYVDPDIARQEWEQFFRGHPQIIGLTGDLPAAGSFFTVDDFGVPVLATRDREGKFRAFLNACRHRGVRLEEESRGKRRRFTCPFHGWTYDQSGALTAIPEAHDFGEIDKSCHSLIELPAVERHNVLWVHPDPAGALDVVDLLGPLEPELGQWDFSDMTFMGESLIEKDLNWKFANDTFGETYHFSRLHRNTLANIFVSDRLSFEEMGKNHRFVFANQRIHKVRQKPEAEWNITHGAAVLYYMFPNVHIGVGRGTIDLIKIYPDATNPMRSVTRIGHYFSQSLLDLKQEKEAETGVKVTADNIYDPDARAGALPDVEGAAAIFDSTVEHEDYWMGETTQQSIRTGLIDHLIFGRNEPALHHFHTTFREELGLPPMEVLQ